MTRGWSCRVKTMVLQGMCLTQCSWRDGQTICRLLLRPDERFGFCRDRIARLRATLRERLVQSPYCQGERFMRNLEREYTRMWKKWCVGAIKDVEAVGDVVSGATAENVGSAEGQSSSQEARREQERAHTDKIVAKAPVTDMERRSRQDGRARPLCDEGGEDRRICERRDSTVAKGRASPESTCDGQESGGPRDRERQISQGPEGAHCEE